MCEDAGRPEKAVLRECTSMAVVFRPNCPVATEVCQPCLIHADVFVVAVWQQSDGTAGDQSGDREVQTVGCDVSVS